MVTIASRGGKKQASLLQEVAVYALEHAESEALVLVARHSDVRTVADLFLPFLAGVGAAPRWFPSSGRIVLANGSRISITVPRMPRLLGRRPALWYDHNAAALGDHDVQQALEAWRTYNGS